MATSAQTEPPRSVPDMGKLNNMTMRTITVTKLTSKTGPGHLVIPPWKNASVDQITSLLSTVPQSFGSGTYRFEVFDESGEKDVWTAKLGANAPDLPEGPMSNPMIPGMGGNGAGGAGHIGPNPDGTRNLGHGYVYDPETGTLTTPQKQIFSWRPGEPLPGGLPSGGASSWPAGTTWMPGQPPTMPGATPWGGGQYPVDDRVEQLKEQLRLAEDRRREDERRRDAEAQQAALRTMIEENNKRFEALVSKLADKPSGPSPEMLAMQARLEAAERAAEQARREAADREREAEARRREDQLRVEMKAQADRTEAVIRELSTSKQDPMVAVLGQIMTAQQTATSSMVTAMQNATQVQAKASEENARLVADRFAGSILTPDRTVELIRLAKDRGPEHEASKGLAEMYRTVFTMAQDLIRVQAEINSAGAEPSWVPMVQQGMQQLGRIAQVYAQAKAQQPQQPQTPPPSPRRVVHRPQPVATAPAAVAAAPGAPPLRAVPPGPPREQTPEEVRDAAAAQVYGPKGPDGRPVGRREAPPAAPAAPPAQAAQPRRGRAARAAAPVQPVAPAVAPAPVAAVPAVVAPAPGTPAPIANVSPDTIRELVSQMSDEEIFGPALPHVLELRQDAMPDENGDEVEPDEIVGFIFEARQRFLAFGAYPPCVELLDNGHIEILLERLLPDASAELRQEIADGVRVRLRSEDAGIIEAEAVATG